MKTKFACKPSQRQCVTFDCAKHGGKPMVVTDELVWEWRSGYMEPHRYWDWLLENCNGPYELSLTTHLNKLIAPKHYGAVSIIVFDQYTDACKFKLTHGGELLRDYLETLQEEQEFERIFAGILRAPREIRRAKFPGLDELVLSCMPELRPNIGTSRIGNGA